MQTVINSHGTIWPQEKTIATIRYYTKYRDTIRYDTIQSPNTTRLNEWRWHRAATSDHAAAVIWHACSVNDVTSYARWLDWLSTHVAARTPWPSQWIKAAVIRHACSVNDVTSYSRWLYWLSTHVAARTPAVDAGKYRCTNVWHLSPDVCFSYLALILTWP